MFKVILTWLVIRALLLYLVMKCSPNAHVSLPSTCVLWTEFWNWWTIHVFAAYAFSANSSDRKIAFICKITGFIYLSRIATTRAIFISVTMSCAVRFAGILECWVAWLNISCGIVWCWKMKARINAVPIRFYGIPSWALGMRLDFFFWCLHARLPLLHPFYVFVITFFSSYLLPPTHPMWDWQG